MALLNASFKQISAEHAMSFLHFLQKEKPILKLSKIETKEMLVVINISIS